MNEISYSCLFTNSGRWVSACLATHSLHFTGPHLKLTVFKPFSLSFCSSSCFFLWFIIVCIIAYFQYIFAYVALWISFFGFCQFCFIFFYHNTSILMTSSTSMQGYVFRVWMCLCVFVATNKYHTCGTCNICYSDDVQIYFDAAPSFDFKGKCIKNTFI